MNDVLADIVRANLAASLAILAVLALRLPVRRHLGAHSAYALWLMAPLVFLASLVPAAEAQTAEDAAAAAAQLDALLPLPLQALRTLSHIPTLTEVWIVGLALAVALVAAGQLRFLRRARAGLAGPALVGVICPRMVTPRGYDTLFTEEERALVRAHERAHIDRGDPKVNALIALAQCLCWFNPLVHLAAHLARLDQELACDATVMYRRPGARRLYAETMLKTQLTSSALPLGCHWLPGGRHPFEARIGMLKRSNAGYWRQQAGAWGAAGLALAVGFGAWAAQPPVKPHQTLESKIYAIDVQHDGQPAIVMIRLSRAEIDALPSPPRS
jgi:beta-lactamase regulating signal transducer with metallopeptidase domain